MPFRVVSIGEPGRESVHVSSEVLRNALCYGTSAVFDDRMRWLRTQLSQCANRFLVELIQYLLPNLGYA